MTNYYSILVDNAERNFLLADLDGTITPIPSIVNHWFWLLLTGWSLQLYNLLQQTLGGPLTTAYQQPKRFRIRLNEPTFEQIVFLDLAPENGQCRLRVGACWKWAVGYFQELDNTHKKLQAKLRKEKAQRILKEKLDKITDIFPFGKLPGELKMKIYGFALELDEHATPYRYTSKRLANSFRPFTEAPAATGLLLANKSIWSGASSLLYSNTFSFTRPKLFEKFLTQLTPESRATIKKIHLEFDHEDILCLFGFLGQHPSAEIDFANLRKLLKGMNLAEFTLFLPNPRRLRYASFTRPACHTVLCKWIINACIETMHHIDGQLVIEDKYLGGEQHDELEAEITREEGGLLFEGHIEAGGLAVPPYCGCASPCHPTLY
ncbi:MAG: hypothetical protein M1835_002084 [Candelina submexicana]|nr:MAG: hypothetical protein M1835_002084 [Candelina submexicana]